MYVMDISPVLKPLAFSQMKGVYQPILRRSVAETDIPASTVFQLAGARDPIALVNLLAFLVCMYCTHS